MTPDVESRTCSIHGHTIHYRIAGFDDAGSETRPTLLLVHGMAGSSRTWREVMGTLGQTHRVVAPDLIGHGQSDTPLGDYSLGAHASGLRDLLGALDIERATIVGQSLGGGITMQLAYQYPELCERLVLVSSGGLGREVTWILRALSFPGTEFLGPVLFPGFVREAGNSVSRFVANLGWHSPQADEMWHAYSSLTVPAKREAFMRTLRSVVDRGGQTVSARDRLYLAATVPTLVVWGGRDPVIPVSHAREAQELMPGSRLEILEGVGHFPHVEASARFVDILEDFVASTEPGEPDRELYRRLLTDG
jgi:pimeloyl-ACP methyl ester carboxylesterase